MRTVNFSFTAIFFFFFLFGLQAQEKGLFKNLGPQVYAAKIQGSTFVKTATGKEFLYTVVRGNPARLLGYEVATQKLEINLELNGMDGASAIAASTDGALYVAAGHGYLFKHAIGSQEVENLGLALKSEGSIWDLAAGKGGEVFGGTYPGGRVFRYHPKDGFTAIGNSPIAPGAHYARTLSYDEKNHKLYVGTILTTHVIEVDLKTQNMKEILPEIHQTQGRLYQVKVVQMKKGSKLLVWKNNDKLKKRETLVFDTKTGALESSRGSMEVKNLVNGDKKNTGYYSVGTHMYSAELTHGSADSPKRLFSFKGEVLASRLSATNEIAIFTTEGEIIHYNPKKGGTSIYKLEIPRQPIDIQSISFGPDGKIWSGGYLAGGHATYDPVTKKSVEYTGLIQTEGFAKQGDDLYIGIYPGGNMYRYNTTAPWDMKKKNPELLKQVAGQSRAFAILSVDALKKVYFGTVPEYGMLGGAISEYNTQTKEFITYHDIVKEQSPVCMTYKDGLIWGGSSVSGGLGIAPSTKEGKLFCWDPVTKKTVFEDVPMPGVMAITALINGPDGNLWGMAGGEFFIYDTKTKKVTHKEQIYEIPPRTHLWRDAFLVIHPSGKVYGTGGYKVFSIDPATKKVDVLREGLHLLTMDNKGAMYFVKGADLWSYLP